MKASKTRRAIVLIGFVAVVAAPVYGQSDGAIPEILGRLGIGKAANYRNLTIYPLLMETGAATDPQSPKIVTMDEALSRGWLLIEEKDGGSVPEVLVTNRSEHMIFLMGGEILSGCRQDRIVRKDVLIRPWRKKLAVPVYCVEQGRWTYRSESFTSEKNLGTFELRSAAQKSSGESQYVIWDTVSESNRKMAVASDTDAFQDALRDEKVESRIVEVEESIEKEIRLPRSTVGVVVCIGGEIVSFDVFGSHALFRELWPKILRASALSAFLSDGPQRDASGVVDAEEVGDLLDTIADARSVRLIAVDLGEEIRIEKKRIQANALAFRSRVLHLCGFAESPETVSGERISEGSDAGWLSSQIPAMQQLEDVRQSIIRIL